MVMALWVVYVDAVDDKLNNLWDFLRTNSMFMHDSFEPITASAAFMLWITMWRMVDFFVPTLHKYKLIPSSVDNDRDFYPENGPLSVMAYLGPILVVDFFYPRRKLPQDIPSSFGIAGMVFASVFLYDLLIYFCHIMFHKTELLKPYHVRHHKFSPLLAGDIVGHSLSDGSVQVLCNIISLNLLKSHPVARTLHNIVVTYMLTECHSGYDAPWMLHRVVPFGILGGSPRHEAHHQTGKVYYHQFFTYLDNMFGYVLPEEPVRGTFSSVTKPQRQGGRKGN